MKKKSPKVKYMFIDPNSRRDMQKFLKTILVEKLLAAKAAG